MQLNTGGEGIVGPSDQTTPHTPHTAPFFSIEKSATCSVIAPRPIEGTTDADQPTTDAAKEGVEAGFDTNADVEAAFPGSSCVTSTSSIVTHFL